MNRPHDLQHLWKTQPVDPGMKGEEMRKLVLKKMEKFDRIIKWRNRTECVAALAVAAFFAYAAWIAPNGIARLGSAIIVGGALWIIYYIRKHGTEPADPNPDQTLAGYQTALARKYDHQIRLLRNVKFWYLLPMYIGLLTLSAGIVAEKGAFTWKDAFGPLIYTLFFAGVWWLNEVHTVRKLQRRRTQLISGMEGDAADV
jgi:hypothetical protein